ncbi:hypothetical protein M0638_19895 [Roseomonas sp. NAR14]|uniref:Secreted protein n=1 Tax=Roseomonas acroporae TaxID=2937791 RepID=A0A9X2BVF5_9PROT|nr:hypothetical protein [Roseomonas acroporae]MCK8786642.1 hypothetical protein [Roseomonas acroporae]
MQTDRYTKSVLTVIAAALVALVVQNAVPKAEAQNRAVQPVALCSMSGDQCVSVGKAGPNNTVGVLAVQNVGGR